jgi:hypothetical protein
MADYNEWVENVTELYDKCLEQWELFGFEPCKWKMLVPDNKEIIAVVSYSHGWFRLSNGKRLPIEVDKQLTGINKPDGGFDAQIMIVPIGYE